MGTPVIILVDSNERYLAPLELKLIEKFGANIDLHIITDQIFLTSFFNSPRKVDVLVINEEWYSPEFERHSIDFTFILSEVEVDENRDDKCHKIYKYTSVIKILNDIVDKSNLEANDIALNTQVIMAYSPIGGVGKTTLSLGLCAALSKQHRRVLYMNTESFQSFQFMLKDKRYCTNGFEKLLGTRPENIMRIFQGAVGKELFNYVLPFKQATSALNIVAEDYTYLLDSIKASGQFEYIVMDSTVDFTVEKSMMMRHCDKVLIATMQDEISVMKLEPLINNIDCSNQNKFVFVCNKYKENEKNYLIEEKIASKCVMNAYIHDFQEEPDQHNIDFLANNAYLQKLAYIFI
ncbi:MAG: hypothetical protein CVU95_15850 [Firmicutes bacterium HGW-Firmicutes-2]|jgi:cellulose biosynthesis protein BcsQ|nr:MAG: hypothetical protein CVU95_15850 [Firmicutes bacterium HGW-Firmicutes-2]